MNAHQEKETIKSCLLCGVGGQGTVLASRIIAAAAMEKGLFARTAETIGMAQRGGSVVSHVRIGQTVPSPLIPPAGADVIIGFEPGEALRNIGTLKKDGTVIVCKREVQPVTAALAGSDYRGETIIAWLSDHVKRCIVLDTEEIITACGSAKVVNVALLGALAATDVMHLTLDDIRHVLKQKIKAEYLALNEKALALGNSAVEEK